MSWNPFDSEKLSETMKNSWSWHGSMDKAVIDAEVAKRSMKEVFYMENKIKSEKLQALIEKWREKLVEASKKKAEAAEKLLKS